MSKAREVSPAFLVQPLQLMSPIQTDLAGCMVKWYKTPSLSINTHNVYVSDRQSQANLFFDIFVGDTSYIVLTAWHDNSTWVYRSIYRFSIYEMGVRLSRHAPWVLDNPDTPCNHLHHSQRKRQQCQQYDTGICLVILCIVHFQLCIIWLTPIEQKPWLGSHL